MKKLFNNVFSIFVFLTTLLLLIGCGNNETTNKKTGSTGSTNQTSLSENNDSVNVLVIGNSSTYEESYYVYEYLKDYETNKPVNFACLYSNVFSLEDHVNNIKNNNKVYDYYLQEGENNPVTKTNESINGVLDDLSWNYIILEQSYERSEIANDYASHLSTIIKELKKDRPNAKYYFSTSIIPSGTDNERNTKFENISYAIKNFVKTNKNIDKVFYTGTLIENLRTSELIDDIFNESFKLSDLGKRIVSAYWVKEILNIDLGENIDGFITRQKDVFSEALNNVILNPLSITISTEYPKKLDFKYQDSLYLLAIGNSFTANSFEYLFDFVSNIGIKEFVIAYLYIGGSSLEDHVNNYFSQANSYSYRRWGTGIGYKVNDNTSIQTALNEYEWDIITVQQVSQNSGMKNTVEPHLTRLLTYLKRDNKNENTKYGYHMTWAYQSDSSHFGFPLYNNNQLTMYESIVDVAENTALVNEDIDFIIPSGTTIQNLRTSSLGDTLTQDGYHLGKLGCYAAGLTWIKTITGIDLEKITYMPIGVGVSNHIAEIKKAVDDAYSNPYKISSQK